MGFVFHFQLNFQFMTWHKDKKQGGCKLQTTEEEIQEATCKEAGVKKSEGETFRAEYALACELTLVCPSYLTGLCVIKASSPNHKIQVQPLKKKKKNTKQ